MARFACSVSYAMVSNMLWTSRLLILYLALLPFQWALSPTETIDLPLARFLAPLLVLFWIAENLWRKRFILSFSLELFFLSAFLFWATLSLFWAENMSFAFRKILFLVSFLPLFVVFQESLKEKRLLKGLLMALVFGAATASGIALLQFFSQFIFGVEKVFTFWTQEILPFFLGGAFGAQVAAYPSLLVNLGGITVLRASAFFPDPHMCSLYLGLSLPLALYLFWQARETQSKWTPYFLAPLLLILAADVLTFSRGGYAGLLGGLLLSGGMLFFRTSILSFSFKQKFLLGLAVLILGGGALLSPIGARFLSSFSSEDGSNVERLRLWEEGAGYIAAHPIGGSGMGNYPLAVKPSAGYREPIYVHNLFLDIASEVGLVGLFFFLGFWFLLFTKLWREAQGKNALSVCLFLSLSIFFIHTLFETPLYSVHVLPALLFVAALASRENSKGIF